MAHHFVPRQLLRRFSNDEKIWAYDKHSSKPPFHTGVERVAAERKMYTEELEKQLNLEIEIPFNEVLPLFRKMAQLTQDQRLSVARYLITMIRRTPSGRDVSRAAVIPVAQTVRQETLTDIDAIEREAPEISDFSERAKANAERIFQKIAEDDGTDLWQATVLPKTYSYPRFTAALMLMNWTVLSIEDSEQLLISDSPVYYEKSYGIKPPEGEVTFPLSSKQLFVANWRAPKPSWPLKPTHQVIYKSMRSGQIREWNRRATTNAKRWIYFQTHEEWMPAFFNKPHKLATHIT